MSLFCRKPIATALVIASLLVTGCSPEQAQDTQAPAGKPGPLSAADSDPKTLGWMEGFPPPPEKLITQPDSNYFSFPKLRWTVCHLREFLPTEQVSRGLGAPVALDYALDEGIDAVLDAPAWEATHEAILAGIRAGLAEAEGGDAAPDRWTRIWESRTARLAWAASIGVLIFGHLVIGGSVSAGPAEPAFPLAAAAGSNDELSEIIGLQRMSVDLPGWEIPSRIAVAPTIQWSRSEDSS